MLSGRGRRGFARACASGFPWATFVIQGLLPRLLIAVGFCGAYTTFSTLSYEAFSYIQERAFLLAGTYILASVVAGLVGTIGGYAAGSLAGRA